MKFLKFLTSVIFLFYFNSCKEASSVDKKPNLKAMDNALQLQIRRSKKQQEIRELSQELSQTIIMGETTSSKDIINLKVEEGKKIIHLIITYLSGELNSREFNALAQEIHTDLEVIASFDVNKLGNQPNSQPLDEKLLQQLLRNIYILYETYNTALNLEGAQAKEDPKNILNFLLSFYTRMHVNKTKDKLASLNSIENCEDIQSIRVIISLFYDSLSYFNPTEIQQEIFAALSQINGLIEQLNANISYIEVRDAINLLYPFQRILKYYLNIEAGINPIDGNSRSIE